MSNDNEVPKNGQTAPIEDAPQPEYMDVRLLSTGQLVKAFWFGMNKRDELQGQLMVAKMQAEQNPQLAADIRFQGSFKDAQRTLAQAGADCLKLEAEFDIRFASIDAMRHTVAREEIAAEQKVAEDAKEKGN